MEPDTHQADTGLSRGTGLAAGASGHAPDRSHAGRDRDAAAGLVRAALDFAVHGETESPSPLLREIASVCRAREGRRRAEGARVTAEVWGVLADECDAAAEVADTLLGEGGEGGRGGEERLDERSREAG